VGVLKLVKFKVVLEVDRDFLEAGAVVLEAYAVLTEVGTIVPVAGEIISECFSLSRDR
jgi:hypothetical protein